ncbi:MAG: glycosyl transferase family protein [Ferruginibacter sp.]|nr:glycosyl transferase family protein [Ferruginibacter sp.]
MDSVKNSQPLVSVIIPSYNHAAFLKARIDSVLQQTVKDIEIIILDDASNDGSVAIIIEALQNNTRIKFLPADKNSGSTFIQWNKGIARASADIIWIAESDDVADPDFLSTMLEALSAEDKIVLAYCQSQRMNEEGAVTGSWYDFTEDLDSRLFSTDFRMGGQEYISRFLIHRNTIPNASAVLFKKSAYLRAGEANEHLPANGDWLCWLKMLCYGNIAFSAKPMNYFRYHAHSVIAKANSTKAGDVYKENYDRTMREIFAEFVSANNIELPTAAKKRNATFMSYDIGNEGLFLLKQGQRFSGWRKVIAATFYAGWQSGFIKKAIRNK